MKKYTCHKVLLVMFIISIVSISSTSAKTITSANQGGLWGEKTTWIGNVVPTQTDDVIINSVVTTGDVYYTTRTYKMANLTINQGGKILREADKSGYFILEVAGNLLNNGEIIDYLNYFDIWLFGNLENNGILKPRNFSLSGTNQQLSGSQPIGPKTFNFKMTDEVAFATSNLSFNNCYIPKNGTKQLNMGAFSLSLSADSITFDTYYGKVISDASLNIPTIFNETGTLILDKAIVTGTISGSLKIESPTYAFIADLLVEGDVTISAETKVSSYRDLQDFTITGDFTNYGEMNNDTVRVGSVKFSPIRMSVVTYGNVVNYGETGSTRFYLNTNGETKSVSGSFGGEVTFQQSEGSETPGGKILIKEEVSIKGKLNVYADLEIAKGGSLNLLYKEWGTPIYVSSTKASIKNNGNMYRYFRINNDWSYRAFKNQPGTSVDFEVRDWEGVLDGVDVSVFNGKTYPNLPGSTKRFWRITSVGEATDFKYILKLYYDESLLNGQKEENLNVYRSTDEGESWVVVSVGDFAVLDTVENSITIGSWTKDESMLSEFGDFVISSGDGSVPTPSPIIVSLTGSKNVRLGAPNRYTVHLYNAGNSRSKSFMTAVTVTDDIVFKQVEIPTKYGVEIVPIDSIGTAQDHTELFFVPYLESHEDYSFDVIVVGVNEGTKSAKAVPQLTAIGLVSSAYDGEVEDYYVRKINELAELDKNEAIEYARGMGITVAQLEMKKKEDSRGVWAFKTTVKYAVEEASKANPLTNIAFKIGNTIERVAKVKDSIRRRIWHWLYKEVGLYGVEEVKVVSGKTIDGKIVTSWDPNEKLGSVGYGTSNFIATKGRMYYTIAFENKKEATAPAYRVQVLDTLSAVFNPETVKFGATSHSGVQYNWKMEKDGNILKWDIEGIELPPNQTPPEGEGFVTFSVDLMPGLASGIEIENRATIIFDINEPITTNTWVNILDTEAPLATMNPVVYEAGDTLINVSCQAVDNENGSGIGKHEFYVSVDNKPFKLIGESYENAFQYRISDSTKNNYRFYALVYDNVENMQKSVPVIAELNSLLVHSDFYNYSERDISFYPNPVSDFVNIDFQIKKDTRVEVKLYSITGKILKDEFIGNYPVGQHQVHFDMAHLKPGIYFAKVLLNEKTKSFKLLKK